jgi:hypothetical protein
MVQPVTQHPGGWDSRISSFRPAWATQWVRGQHRLFMEEDPVSKKTKGT